MRGRGASGMLRALAAVGLLVAFLPSAGAVSPDHHWRTLRGGGFVIIYSEGEEALAARALAIAGQAAAKIDARFHWIPLEPVRIVLTDDIGLSNGFTSVFPRNVIEIYVTPPSVLTDGLARYGDWLRLVITHEYTHIVQLGMVHGWPAALRRWFGRNPLLFPGEYQPTLLIEGLAVHEESDPALDIGRSGGPLFAMEMRAEVDAGLKPWNEVSMYGVTDWPAGDIPYLYGSYFYKFLVDSEGKQTLPKLVDNYSGNLIPFRVGGNLEDTTGRSREQLWDDFRAWLRSNLGKLPYPRGVPLTGATRLTHFGYETQSVRAAADGRVFFVRNDYRSHPALMVWQAGKGARAIAPVFTPATIDFNAQAGVLVARPEVCDEYKVYFDLYRMNPANGGMERLTHCGRYRYAAWSPDGTRIAAVHRALGTSSLVLLKADGKRLTNLWTGRNHAVIGPIDWSPTGNAIVATVWRPVRGWALEEFDLATRKWRVLTAQAGMPGDPQYTPDGRGVLFTSDAGGIYNLRRLDLVSGKTTTLTHVATGAFSPSQGSSGGPIFYLGYSADGYDLYELGAGQMLDEPLAPLTRPKLPAPTETPPGVPASTPYSPWSSLAPAYWMPVVALGPGYSEIGASTSGVDALGLHSYSADLTAELEHQLVGGSFYYQYADRFVAGIERDFRFDTDSNENLARVRRQDYAQAIFMRPFPSYEQTLTPMAGISTQADADAIRISQSSPAYRSTTAGIALDWNTSQNWPISISPNNGQDLLLVAETSRPFGGDFDGTAYRVDWHGYLPLGGEAVMALHYLEGYATAGARPFNLGGPNLSGATPAEGLVFNHHNFRLRGYPSGLAALTGDRVREATVEARIPIAHPEAAWDGIGLHQASLRPFVDAGAAWNGGVPPRYYESAGAEAVFDLNLLYNINFRLIIGVAHGFAGIGENQIYASVSLPLG